MEMNPDKKFNDIIEDITYKANLTFQVIETNLGAAPSDEDVERWRENSSLFNGHVFIHSYITHVSL